jgi:hypothetical protein
MTVPAPVTVFAAAEALQHWAPVAWLKASIYAYPALEMVHIVGIALVFGTIWLVDLRLLGFLRSLDIALLVRQVLPWTLCGFALAALSGLLMFSTSAAELIANRAFLMKVCLLLLAGTNAALLHARGPLRPAQALTRCQAVLSIALWLAVIACGRWIAYA